MFKPLPRAKSVEMLDKGLTPNIFAIYFFWCSSKTLRLSLLILTFCLDLLPRPSIFFHDKQSRQRQEKVLTAFLFSISRPIL